MEIITTALIELGRQKGLTGSEAVVQSFEFLLDLLQVTAPLELEEFLAAAATGEDVDEKRKALIDIVSMYPETLKVH